MTSEENPLCWLHLSDFHVGQDIYGQKQLFKYIHQEIIKKRDQGLHPDIIFITGDVANSGRVEEYEEFGVHPSDQTAHQVKNVVYLKKRIPKEKTDERKSSQQRIQTHHGASAREWRKAPGSDLPRA
jgi:hypothetical protein